MCSVQLLYWQESAIRLRKGKGVKPKDQVGMLHRLEEEGGELLVPHAVIELFTWSACVM